MRTRAMRIGLVLLSAFFPAAAMMTAGCASVPGAVAAGGEYAHAAIAADHPLASEAGVEMLEQGGNAVDAAVATSFCLSVVRPYSCGIGGGGFMIIHMPPPEVAPEADPEIPGAEPVQVAINYRETAPAAVGPDYYINLDVPRPSRDGVHAVGTPGSVAGLLYALEQYGTLERAAVLAPAIRAAEEGFAADADYVRQVRKTADRLKRNPDLRETSTYIWEQLCHRGHMRIGDIITNPQQAKALRLIAEQGAAAFYEGEIGAAIVDVMQRHGGAITAADLAGYEISITEPLKGRFQGLEILSMPPPSSGGIAMQQVLGILQRRPIDPTETPHNSVEYVHLVAEAMKHAFADRAEWLADPAFVRVPVKELLHKMYLDGRAAAISPYHTQEPYTYGSVTPPAPGSRLPGAPEDGGTSHFCVVDERGMAVACTETVNLTFGSMVNVEGFGFALNNEMDDFTTDPGAPNAFGLRQSDRNLPEPGKRPLSSMSPTILLRDGQVVLIAGASGGPRIITATLQCILNCLWYGMTPQQAVDAKRFHHQWMPNVLRLEKSWSDRRMRRALKELGHETERREEVGVVQLIRLDRGAIRAACDGRKGGRPAGY